MQSRQRDESVVGHEASARRDAAARARGGRLRTSSLIGAWLSVGFGAACGSDPGVMQNGLQAGASSVAAVGGARSTPPATTTAGVAAESGVSGSSAALGTPSAGVAGTSSTSPAAAAGSSAASTAAGNAGTGLGGNAGGVAGVSGASGASGVVGASGASGTSGASGASGAAGASSAAGASGVAGAAGAGGGSAGPGVCDGTTPHGCYVAQPGNHSMCPAQSPEQSAYYPPMAEWKGCNGIMPAQPFGQDPMASCSYKGSQGQVATCLCDTGLHWLCMYPANP